MTKNKKLILIIDNDEKVVLFLKEHLTDAGYKVITAQNGTEGLKLAEKEKPDLIVLDITIDLTTPEINGVNVLQILKQKDKTKDIPVIVFSCHCKEESIVAVTRKLGAAACFEKSAMPFEDFFKRIKGVLKA